MVHTERFLEDNDSPHYKRLDAIAGIADSEFLRFDRISPEVKDFYRFLLLTRDIDGNPVSDNNVPFVKINDPCFLLSHPGGGHLRVSFGKVTDIGNHLIHHNCPSKRGSSGGALCNAQGNIIRVHIGSPTDDDKIACKIWRFIGQVEDSLHELEHYHLTAFEAMVSNASAAACSSVTIDIGFDLPIDYFTRAIDSCSKFTFKDSIMPAYQGIGRNTGYPFNEFMKHPEYKVDCLMNAAAKATCKVIDTISANVITIGRSIDFLICIPKSGLVSVKSDYILVRCGYVNCKSTVVWIIGKILIE